MEQRVTGTEECAAGAHWETAGMSVDWRWQLGREWVTAQVEEETRTESSPDSFTRRFEIQNQKAASVCNSSEGKARSEPRLFIVLFIPLGVNIHAALCRGIKVPDCRELPSKGWDGTYHRG